MKTTFITRQRDAYTPPVPQSVARIDPYEMAALMGLAPAATRLPVTDRTVVGLPAAWAAVNKVSNAVSQMMVGAEVLDGRESLDPRPTIVERPNNGYGSFTFWKEVVTTTMLRGNYIAINVDPDGDGWPQQVVPIPTEMVNCSLTPDGYVDYEINKEHYSPDQITHVRCGITLPGLPWAIGVVEAHRRGLSGAIDQQLMSNDLWRNGAVPSGVVQLDTDSPTTDQVQAVKAAWIGAIGLQRTVAVTGKRMSYTPITWSADDAQYIQSRQFSVAEIALMFGLRPSDLDSSIGGAGALTYGNRQDDALQRITDSYMPYMLPVEQAWSDLLPGRLFVKGNVEALMRSTTKQRYEVHEIAQRIGLQTADETRQIEGRAAAAPTEQEVKTDA